MFAASGLLYTFMELQACMAIAGVYLEVMASAGTKLLSLVMMKQARLLEQVGLGFLAYIFGGSLTHWHG